MAQAPNSAGSTTGNSAALYPQLESSVAPIDESEQIKALVEEERKLQTFLQNIGKPLDDVHDRSFLPEELFADTKKKSNKAKPKIDPLKRLKDLPADEQEEEEEEPEDEEEEIDEEKVEDEEDDAGGDYLNSHFDNGENFEDNDEEGIGASYWYYGILQERITRTKHEPGEEMFTCTMTLVLLQCIFNTIFAKFMLMFIFKQGADRTKPTYYAICSLTYLTAMVSSNMALRHVNYPTQVVGKSCKPIPIMILGVLIGRKRHALKKYLFILLIVIGVALFMYKKDLNLQNLFQGNDQHSTGSNQSSTFNFITSLGFGELLLLLSLSMDGVTGAIQERMKSDYMTKSGHMMFKINLWSTAYLMSSTLLTGEIYEFSKFIDRHPSLMYDITLFSSLSAIGQLFIFLTVAEFGPLSCSVVTTTRKFFTVLTSVFLFGNSLTPTQWIGTTLVFTGLSLDAIYGKGG